MEYEMFPVIQSAELEDALKLQYGQAFADEIEDLSSFLFGDYEEGACYKYNFDRLEVYTGKFWQDETSVNITNCIKGFLQDFFPERSVVIIQMPG